MLYCGTEFGIWVSVNRGAAWAKINNNLPTVAVHEVAQPTTASEIVVATHGRSVWVLDVNSLRQMSERTERVGNEDKKTDPLKDAVTLFAPAPVDAVEDRGRPRVPVLEGRAEVLRHEPAARRELRLHADASRPSPCR